MDILEQIKSLSGNVKGIYKNFLESTDNIDVFAFEIAQQANTNKMARAGAERAVGKEIVELALKLYPNVKLGDTYNGTKQQKEN